jgi:trimethylamine--corrinoid protein Co-methyltransferase
MSEPTTSGEGAQEGGRRHGRGGGREARRAARAAAAPPRMPYITRKVPYYEVLTEEGLRRIEDAGDTILKEIGIEFRGDPEVIALFKAAGADVQGERVRFETGMLRQIIRATAPREFTQYARNPANNVVIGGPNTVLAPNYGSPFVRDLDHGRRYATIEDFRNFVKLAYLSPHLHHSGGTVCEPVDLPVHVRHLDMVYSHLRWSDKPFMGSVTAPERAQDSVDMAGLVFGREFVDQHCVMVNLINSNSPLVYDSIMLGALKVYARNFQACVVSPFILSGAMSPVTVAATLAQLYAEAQAGIALTQLIRPGCPVIFGTFSSSISMQSGAPTFGGPEPALVLYGAAQLARRLGVPFRSGGNLCASKIPDAQAAYESANTFQPTLLAGVNFCLHAAGWSEGGLAINYEKFMMDADQCGMAAIMLQGVDTSDNGLGLDAEREVGPGGHFLGCAHTQANFESAFYRSPLADNNSVEQWEAEGSKDMVQRANEAWKKALREYEAPPIDAGIDQALHDYMERRKREIPPSEA